jgi:CheY-like chemotaxis protein
MDMSKDDPIVVLLVDDEPLLRRSLAVLLKRLGYNVIEAGNGPAALEALRHNRHHVDVMLTDIIMPMMSGVMLAHEVRRLYRCIKIFFMSASTIRLLKSEYGLDDDLLPLLLFKPFTIETLTSMISQVLADQPDVFGPRSDRLSKAEITDQTPKHPGWAHALIDHGPKVNGHTGDTLPLIGHVGLTS